MNLVDRDHPFDFDNLPDQRGAYSAKWDKYRGRDIIPLWLADMDFRSPPAVIEALRRRVEHGVFSYPSVPPELVEVILSMLQAAYGWEVKPEWLVWLPGLVSALNVICRAAAAPGEEVLTAAPVYPPFLSAPKLSGRGLATVPLIQAAGRWTFDFERLESLITPRTRLFLLCNPHNPVGRVYTKEELTALARICEQHDLIICADEIHCGLILDADKTHVALASLDPAIAARTVTLMSPSKTFNLPGLGCAFAIISDEQLRRKFKQAKAGIVPGVNLLGYVAALAAYRDGAEWHAALLSYLRANRDLITGAVNSMPGLSMTHVEATYLAWIDTRGAGPAEPVKFFENAGVGLADGAAFGGPGFVRLSFACPRVTLAEALNRMRRALE
ncbi:MAG: putative C-S lyase [Deltaproteobacteria bacterium]|nr:MAG: putative C-S lyase [Deltaproteobacteria bacterium]